MEHTRNEELAWAAGFFDGEGYIGLVNIRKPYKRLECAVAQTRVEPLDRFCAIVGNGKVRGPYKHKKGNRSPYWQYSVQGYKTIAHVMTLLWPWLSLPKREQAEKAIAEAEIYHAKPRKIRADKGTTGIRTKRVTKAHSRT